jgi:MoaA/NifB/PqqE/SkfB family radical SAM enzyme
LCLVTIITVSLSYIPPANAYNKDDISQLIEKNKCIKCDLSNYHFPQNKFNLEKANLSHSNLQKTSFKNLKVDDWLQRTEKSKINCAVKKEGSIFIDHKGRIFPCCFLAAGLYSRVRHEPINDGWWELWKQHGQDTVNLHDNDWKDIMNSKFWSMIQESWDQKFPNRLATCSGTCSDSNLKFNNIKD